MWTYLGDGFSWCFIVYRNDVATKWCFFHQSHLLYETSVSTKRNNDWRMELRQSKCRTCFLCIPVFGQSISSIAVQNITIPIALTLHEQLKFQHPYRKLICCRCLWDVSKLIDSLWQMLFLCNISSNKFFRQIKINKHLLAPS